MAKAKLNTKIEVTLEGLEAKEAYDWLFNMIKRSFNDPNSYANSVAYEQIKAWNTALEEAVITKEKSEPKPRAERAMAKGEKIDKSGLTCNTHPTYSGQKQRPRIDCDDCWAVYKMFHINEYPAKRRAFEAKMKAQQ